MVLRQIFFSGVSAFFCMKMSCTPRVRWTILLYWLCPNWAEPARPAVSRSRSSPMRLMIDFISGIFSALFQRSDKSCTRRQTGARQTSAAAGGGGGGEGSSGNILGQIIARFLILVLSVGICAAALLTATAPTTAPATHEKTPPPTMIPPAPTTNNFDDILATDPAAHAGRVMQD